MEWLAYVWNYAKCQCFKSVWDIVFYLPPVFSLSVQGNQVGQTPHKRLSVQNKVLFDWL